MSEPVVSVVMATYNHADYVLQAIDGVLRQRGVALELLVQDDGSVDTTPELIGGVRDPRLRYFPKEHNEGQAVTTNFLIRQARGEFVAVINSDDVWPLEDKLAEQVDVMRSRPTVGACFSHAGFLDGEGRTIPRERVHEGAIFEQANRSRGKWLRRFMFEGNCLCHPSVLIRRSCHDEAGLYDTRLRQIFDLAMWVEVVKRHDLHVCPRELVQFRLRPGENAGAPTLSNSRRLLNEQLFTGERLLHGVGEDLLRDGFGDVLAKPDALSPEELEVEKAALYFRGNNAVLWTIGLRRMHQLLGQPHMRPVLADYGIDDAWLQGQMAFFTPYNHRVRPASAPAPQRRFALPRWLGGRA